MKKALVFDVETVPFMYSLDPLISENKILLEEYKKYIKYEQDRGKQDTDIFISHPPFNCIIAIGWLIAKWSNEQGWYIDKDSTGKEKIGCIAGKNEKPILEEFVGYINRNNDIDYFVHFNGHQFDFPIVFFRSLMYSIEIKNKKFKNPYKFKKEPHYDLKLVASNNNSFPLSLRTLAVSLNLEDPKKDNDGKDVLELYHANDWAGIKKYCISDVLTEYRCFEKIEKLAP